MAEYEVPKGKDEIIEGVLLEEDWYVIELVKDELRKNKIWRDAGEGLPIEDVEGAGYSIMLVTKVVSDDAEANGRILTKYLSRVSPWDDGKYMNDGQPKADWKINCQFEWSDAFAGPGGSPKVVFRKGARCRMYIVQTEGQQGDLENQFPMNVTPKPLEDSAFDHIPASSDEEAVDIPF